MQVFGIIALLPALMVIIGTVLGFHALRDIRVAGGSLGSVKRAVFAAGLLPALLIIAACGAGGMFLAEDVLYRPRSQSDTWTTIGCIGGIWLSFLMLRGMHRQATGWVRPARVEGQQSRLAMGAIVLTIIAAAVLLFLILTPAQSRFLPADAKRLVVLADFVMLLAGLICGVLARQEKAGKVCAWICGALFVLALLAAT
jgi:hypothetical protein